MADTDGDKVPDGVEVRYWLTDPKNANTDGDECTDGREVATINGDRVVNPGDQAILPAKIGSPTAQFRPYDQNGNGGFTSATRRSWRTASATAHSTYRRHAA